MDKDTKRTVLTLIKSIKISESYVSEQEEKRKWFRFGAYDALRTLSDMVNDYDEPKPRKKKAESSK